MKITLPDHRSILPHISAVRDFTIRILPYWIAAAMTALISILYARVYLWSEQQTSQWSVVHPALGFLIIPLAFLGSSLLCRYLAPYASGSGIPQVIAALDAAKDPTSPLISKLVGVRVIAVKFVSSCVCVMGGGAIGREGPTLQIAAGIFRFVEKRWAAIGTLNPQSMIMAGGAAGLASAFNTPLGGIIFAIEELAKVHISHVRTTVFHAVIIAGILSQAVLGNYLYLGRVTLESGDAVTKIYLVLVMGVIGVIGALFGLFVVKAMDFRSLLSSNLKTAMTVACGLVVATMFYFGGQDSLGSGREIVIRLLSHPNDAIPAHLGFMRVLANYFAYIGGTAGGVFAPALASGAAFGGWASQFFAGASVQVWILAGMVAFLTGVTRSPFTSMILVIEMTDSHGVILDLMLAAVMAQGAARFVDPLSFYEQLAHRMLHPPKIAPVTADAV
ncbi:hypothetical protein BH10BDE1_BH10BDE1_27520 [soil metagenome]